MPATAVVRARIDEKTKRKAARALKKIGFTVSDAIRITMKRIADEQTLPFELHVPNAETIAALREAESGNLERAVSLEEFLAKMNAND